MEETRFGGITIVMRSRSYRKVLSLSDELSSNTVFPPATANLKGSDT